MVENYTLTDMSRQQYQQALNGILHPPSFFDNFTNPVFMIMAGLVVVLIVLYIYKGKSKDDPANRPWYGRILRKKLMKEEIAKRMDNLGDKPKHVKVILERGLARLGVVTRIEYNYDQYEVKEVKKQGAKAEVIYNTEKRYEIHRFKVRGFGWWAWLKAAFGFGFVYYSVMPNAYTKNYKDKQLIICLNPMIQLMNDSGVWAQAIEPAIDANAKLCMKAHHENIHGYEMDFLRRLSVNSTAVASAMEKESHAAKIKEDERKARSAPYS